MLLFIIEFFSGIIEIAIFEIIKKINKLKKIILFKKKKKM